MDKRKKERKTLITVTDVPPNDGPLQCPGRAGKKVERSAMSRIVGKAVNQNGNRGGKGCTASPSFATVSRLLKNSKHRRGLEVFRKMKFRSGQTFSKVRRHSSIGVIGRELCV